MIFISLLVVNSLCWSGEPHQLIARIAQKMLTKQQNKWINDMLNLWPSESYDLIYVSNWEDTIISDINTIMQQWHFENKPYIQEGYEPKVIKRTYNITNAVTDEINTILDPTTTSVWSFGFSFRALIHFIADSHCPVHSIAYYSDKYPSGDAGGNFIKLNCSISYFCQNLHKLWDSGVLNFQHNKYIAPSLEDFEKNVTRLMKTYPLTILKEYPSLSVYNWINESYDSAINFGYKPLKDFKNIDQDYIDHGADEAELRITLAGYRLGLILQKFFEIRGYPKLPTEPRIFTEVLAWILDAVVVGVILIYTILLCREKASYTPQAFA